MLPVGRLSIRVWQKRSRVQRLDLVTERRETGLNYGGLFVAHELTKNGLAMNDFAARLKSGKDIFQIGSEVNANWKEINDHAKKLKQQNRQPSLQLLPACQERPADASNER